MAPSSGPGFGQDETVAAAVVILSSSCCNCGAAGGGGADVDVDVDSVEVGDGGGGGGGKLLFDFVDGGSLRIVASPTAALLPEVILPPLDNGGKGGGTGAAESHLV